MEYRTLGQTGLQVSTKTLFFPLALYERDTRRTAALAGLLPPGHNLISAAIRYVLDDPHLSAAIIGFRSTAEIDQAVAALTAPPLPDEFLTVSRLALPVRLVATPLTSMPPTR